jgi:hypothetical protein
MVVPDGVATFAEPVARSAPPLPSRWANEILLLVVLAQKMLSEAAASGAAASESSAAAVRAVASRFSAASVSA